MFFGRISGQGHPYRNNHGCADWPSLVTLSVVAAMVSSKVCEVVFAIDA